jgi:predicted membrane-bound spermidine synthase
MVIREETLKGYLFIQVLIGLFALGFPFVIIWLHRASLPDFANYSILGVVTLIISILAGMEYTCASSLQSLDAGRIASKNYSADLFGSALGAFLTSVFLLPLAGLIYTSLILVLLNFISILFLVLTFKTVLKR